MRRQPCLSRCQAPSAKKAGGKGCPDDANLNRIVIVTPFAIVDPVGTPGPVRTTFMRTALTARLTLTMKSDESKLASTLCGMLL